MTRNYFRNVFVKIPDIAGVSCLNIVVCLSQLLKQIYQFVDIVEIREAEGSSISTFPVINNSSIRCSYIIHSYGVCSLGYLYNIS